MACLPQGLLDAEPSLKAGFAHTRFVVLDEADRLLDATFQSDLKTIFEVRAAPIKATGCCLPALPLCGTGLLTSSKTRGVMSPRAGADILWCLGSAGCF